MISTNALSKLKPEPWQLQYLFKIGSKSWLIHIFVVTLVYVVLRSQGDFFFYWFAIMASTSLIMSMLCRIGSSLSPDDDAPRLLRLGVAHTSITITIGILWGAGAIVATQLAPELALFYSLALGGAMLAAVSSQSSGRRSTLCSTGARFHLWPLRTGIFHPWILALYRQLDGAVRYYIDHSSIPDARIFER